MNESNKIEEILVHHGIKGQRWGVRRYQNKDGSLTPLGEKRMDKLNARKTAEDLKDRKAARKLTMQKAKQDRKQDELDRAAARKNEAAKTKAEVTAAKQKAKNTADDEDEELYDVPDARAEAERQKRAETGKKILVGTLAVVGTIAAVYAFKKWREKVGAKKEGEKTAEDAVKDTVEKLKDKKFSDLTGKARESAIKDRAKSIAKANKENARVAAAETAAADKRTKESLDLLKTRTDRIKAAGKAEQKALEKRYLKGKMTVSEFNAAKAKANASTNSQLERLGSVWDAIIARNSTYYDRHR